MPNNNLPTIAQLQDPAWLNSQSQRVQSAVFRATEGKHRAKNDVVKLNSNYVQRRAADKRWKETHPDLYLQQQQQPPADAISNPTPGQSTGGGQGQNVRFNQKIDKMDRRAQAQQQTTAASDRRDAIGDARDAGAPAPRPSTGGSVIGTTSSMGAAPDWWTRATGRLNNLGTPSSLGGNTMMPYNSSTATGSPTVAPNWWTPPAPRNSRQAGAIGVPGGLSPSQRQSISAQLQAARPDPVVPAGVTPGGGFANNADGSTVYYSPDGKRYWVSPDGRFIPSQTNQNNLVGGSDIGTAYDQAALARLALARRERDYMQSLASNPSTFGSYYGGGFGGGYGGGRGGGYTSYDPYNSNPSWYNSLDLTAWNIQ